jgi:hypothetical protein
LKDASQSYDLHYAFKALLFPVLAFFAAPVWFVSFLKTLSQPRRLSKPFSFVSPEFLFVIIFWLVSVVTALATALPQRNLVWPWLLLGPFLIKNMSRGLWWAAFLLQLWTLSHPEQLLRKDLQEERNVLSVVIQESFPQKKILLQLQQGAHAYLPRHLVLRGVSPKQLFVDHLMKELPSQRNHPEWWIRHMIFEGHSGSSQPLVNFWRSWKAGESFLESGEKSFRREILKENDIGIIITPSTADWPFQEGYSCLFQTRDHIVWSREKVENAKLPFRVFPEKKSKKMLFMRAWKEKKINRELWKAFFETIGL